VDTLADKLFQTTPRETAWCPGCGNFGILNALSDALEELSLEPHDVLFVSGIGQAGKTPHYIKGNVFNTLHGRTLPAATGAKLVNPELTVFAIGGDGDGYAEGGNHLLHAMRKNVNITYLVHDNQVFGLTKGQASPRSDQGFVTGTTPQGVSLESFSPLATAITLNAGFVARSFSGNKSHLVETIQAAVNHEGFSIVDILQPCVTFNKINTFQWYRSRVYDLKDDENYDPSNRTAAWEKAQQWGDRIPIGVFYKVDRATLDEAHPASANGPLVKQGVEYDGVKEILDGFAVNG